MNLRVMPIDSSLPSQIAQRYGAGNHNLIKNYKIGVGKGVIILFIGRGKETNYQRFRFIRCIFRLRTFYNGTEVSSLGKWSK